MYAKTLTQHDLVALGLMAEELPGGTPNKPRDVAPMGVVVHTPGEPFAKAALGDVDPEDAEAFDDAAARRFDRLVYQPNYLVGTTGKVYQLVDDAHRASHAGMLAGDCPAGNVYATRAWREWAKPLGGKGWVRHGRPGDEVYDWWDAAFPGAPGPLAVFPWGRFPNAAVGIDVLPDARGGYGFTEAQRVAVARLVGALASLHGFPVAPTTVTTHSLAAPCERGAVLRRGRVVGVHWDPPASRWEFSVPDLRLVG